MGISQSSQEDTSLRNDADEILEPVVLAEIEPGSVGPILPHHDPEQWALIQARLNLASQLEERYEKRSPNESPSRFLRSIIMSVSSHWKKRHFDALRFFFDQQMDQSEQRKFLSVMSRVAALALKLPEYFSDSSLRFLKQNSVESVSLTRAQIASLLACAMYGCLQPLQGELVGVLSFAGMFTGPAKPWMLAKIRMIIAYFDAITDKSNKKILKDKVIFKRCCIDSKVDWRASNVPLATVSLRAERLGAIERESAAVQADFANASIGGGVMSNGRLQEEIRFCISPELLVSLLLCETMKAAESILIDGTLQFSSYKGYADSLLFDGAREDLKEQRPGDRVLAIDAKFFTGFKQQFKEPFIVRELNKLHGGLSACVSSKAEEATEKQKSEFASGNWGCGAFGGIPQVKALLQLAVCAQNGINLIYFCHTDQRIDPEQFSLLFTRLKKANVTVGQLVSLLVDYAAETDPILEAQRPDLFSYLFFHPSLESVDKKLKYERGTYRGMVGA